MKIHSRYEHCSRRFRAVINVLTFFLSVLLVTGQPFDTAYAQAVSSTSMKSAAIQIRDDLSIGNIRKDIARLSSLDSRVTGYPQAASGSKYIFDRFVETGLQNVESREFTVTVPIDHGDSVIEVLSQETNVLHAFKLTPLWPNLVRTSLLADGIKHTVLADETLKDIAESYQVDETTILADDRNKFLATPVVEGSTVFIPTGGLSGPLLYGDDGELADFNGHPTLADFWHKLQDGDTLTNARSTLPVLPKPASPMTYLMNTCKKRPMALITMRMALLMNMVKSRCSLKFWGGQQMALIMMPMVGQTKFQADATDGLDNNKDGQVDESGEFVAASESHIFIPKGAIVLLDFNSSTRYINAAMLGGTAVIFIQPETTIRGGSRK